MTWTSKSFLEWSALRLAQAGIDSPRLESELLLAQGLRSSREDLYRNPDRELGEAEMILTKSFVERRFQREPVAYILGRREFWGLEFQVTPDVLVPRWETEILIEKFLQWARSESFAEPMQILDFGTGSGNIAIAIAKELPQSQVTAVDISPSAIAIAKANAWVHEVAGQVRFEEGDMFSCQLETSFHAILSNPPYLEEDLKNSLSPDVKDYEPEQALFGGPDGLACYRRILPCAWRHLKEDGVLFLEIGNGQVEDVLSLIEKHGGYREPEVTLDYMGMERVISVRKKNING
jgi:release factor glutamine methyltransferase